MVTSPPAERRPQPKGKRQPRTLVQRIARWGPWNYRFWREIARWCYERSLKNPAVVDPDQHFPEHRELLENYSALRRETLDVALSGRLPANHEIMQQQRTLYEFDRKIWGMLPLRGYGFDYPENQSRIPTLQGFLQRHRDVVSARSACSHRGRCCARTKVRSRGSGDITSLYVDDLGQGQTSCELLIDGTRYFLQEGEGLHRDDTFLHSAVNRSEQPRVVLLFDVFRRDQPIGLVAMSWVFLWVAQIWQRVQNMRDRAQLRP